jgi:hypothetical protein
LSIGSALLLLAWDVGLVGSFGMSFFICPIWFLVSVVKNAIKRPGWLLGFFRVAIPALTLGTVLANNAAQYRVAGANAPRIVKACEAFHVDNGTFPRSLDELVPRYMQSIPRAKYCAIYGEFIYLNYGSPMLIWYAVPPFGRMVYSFNERRWNYID